MKNVNEGERWNNGQRKNKNVKRKNENERKTGKKGRCMKKRLNKGETKEIKKMKKKRH